MKACLRGGWDTECHREVSLHGAGKAFKGSSK